MLDFDKNKELETELQVVTNDAAQLMTKLAGVNVSLRRMKETLALTDAPTTAEFEAVELEIKNAKQAINADLNVTALTDVTNSIDSLSNSMTV